jgi:hypothetical protein
MQNLLKKLRGNSTPPPLAVQAPEPKRTTSQFAHMGATEDTIHPAAQLSIEEGSQLETEITEVTDTEVRSKFMLERAGVEGIGVTPRAKFPAGETAQVGKRATQEIESFVFKDGELTADLRYIEPAPPETASTPATKDDIEDDRIEGIRGG